MARSRPRFLSRGSNGLIRRKREGEAVPPAFASWRCGLLEWVAEGFPHGELMPLLNLLEIIAHPGKPIVLVEGERVVAAASVIFGDDYVVTTTAMGAGSFRRTDVSPVAGRPVIIWRDNDATGEGYARDAAETLIKGGCVIRVVDVAKLVGIDGGARGATHDPDGWDAADALVEWLDLAALRNTVLKLAAPFRTDSVQRPLAPAPEPWRG